MHYDSCQKSCHQLQAQHTRTEELWILHTSQNIWSDVPKNPKCRWSITMH